MNYDFYLQNLKMENDFLESHKDISRKEMLAAMKYLIQEGFTFSCFEFAKNAVYQRAKENKNKS